MDIKINAQFFDGRNIRTSDFTVNQLPDECPLCHSNIDAQHMVGWLSGHILQKVFRCPKDVCQKLFIAYYKVHPDDEQVPNKQKRRHLFYYIAPSKFQKRSFPKIINTISPQFSKIYNEAKEADEIGMKNICGVGYRKAIEFLIKDYLIHVKKMPLEEIKKTPLGNCIKKHIEDVNIKECAKRAVWIGNDETHYIRKWVDKDLQDLKDLIDVTIYWIDSEYKTKRYKIEMPDAQEKESQEP